MPTPSNMFLRVASCAPAVRPADVSFNTEAILEILKELEKDQVDIALFPELCITGYTCADLFLASPLIEAAQEAVKTLCSRTEHMRTAFVVGLPIEVDGTLYNVAHLIAGGKIRTTNGKRFIPNYGEFYERRWFEPWEHKSQLYNLNNIKIGVEICEDLWIPCSPSQLMSLAGADIILNLSASDDVIGKYDYLVTLLKAQSGKNVCGYVYAGAGFGESSTDLVFNGKTLILENGKILACNSRWQTEPNYIVADIDIEALRHDRRKSGYFHASADTVEIIEGTSHIHIRNKSDIMRTIEPRPFVPRNTAERNLRCEEIINLQSLALAQRLDFTGCKSLTVGISGGLDSTLALLVATRAFDTLGLDRQGIHAITMPGFGTTDRTENNATLLCQSLGVAFENIPIHDAVEQHFHDIKHDPSNHDVTYENSQARMRTLILMDLANKYGGMVLGTGDMSELALGWATYNGDHMSMYNVNAGVPKTLVKYLVGWFADEAGRGTVRDVLNDILDTPISPELLPANDDGSIAQVTEDIVGPYELHDFFLYYTLRYGFGPEKIYYLARNAFDDKYSDEDIIRWLRKFISRFFAQQFKRSCMPDAPKVGSVSLSPRGDWRMPSDASASQWLEQIDQLAQSLNIR